MEGLEIDCLPCALPLDKCLGDVGMSHNDQLRRGRRCRLGSICRCSQIVPERIVWSAMRYRRIYSTKFEFPQERAGAEKRAIFNG